MRKFWREEQGVAAIEFAMLSPVMILLLMGAIESAHFVMVKSALDGAVATAARESVAQLNLTEDERDAKMRNRITALMSGYRPAPDRTVTIETTVYRKIGDSSPEPFEDLNRNGVWDSSEPYVDRNRNGTRDLAAPVTGKMGGVGDVVGYSVTYPTAPYFAMLAPIFGDWMDLKTSTISRNEPERGVAI